MTDDRTDRTDRRLDDVAALLGRARPRLDEITRARVASRVEVALREPAVVSSPAPVSRPWRRRAGLALGGLLVAGAAAAGAIALATPPAQVAATVEEPAAPVVAAGPAQIDVPAGASEHVELGDTAITVYGPGRLHGDAERATVHAAAIVVDRPHEDAAPWSLRYDDITVVASRATFAVDRGAAVRVTVMRGEVLLLCEDGAHPVSAGDSAECPRPRSAAAPPIARSTGLAVRPGSVDVAPPVSAPGPAPAPSDVAPAPIARPARAPGPVAPVLVAPAPAPAPLPAPLPAPALPPPPPAEPVPDEAFAMDEPVASSVRPNLYALAEGAMRRGDHEGARAALNAVIEAAPSSVDAATALLDLAMLAHKEGNDARARTILDRLDRHLRRATLLAPAARLRAQLAPP